MTQPGRTRGILGAALLVAILAPRPGAGAEKNQCVACHQTEVLPITLGHSFAEWRGSEHARAGVTCDKCHGGDPTATNADKAHANVLPASDPKSLVHPTHLPATCGGCHPKELEAFDGTVHAQQLRTKGTGATCFTCHGAMATGYPSPRELGARCSVCHDKPFDEQLALTMLAMSQTQLSRTQRTLAEAKAANPDWYATAAPRFHDLERDFHGIQLKWHTFDTKAVLAQSRDVLRLARALNDEAAVMIHRGGK